MCQFDSPSKRGIHAHTIVVSADLQCLVSSHDQSGLAVLLVLQQSHVSSTTLLPLVGITDELEELGAHLEGLLLEFLVGLDINFLCETDDGLEVDIFGFGSFILFNKSASAVLFCWPCTTSGFSSAAAAFCAFADPELSPRSSSSTFSFFAPPPNIEKTLSATPVAALVTVPAAEEAAVVACSVKVWSHQ